MKIIEELRRLVGDENEDHFDQDLITFVNGAMANLGQIGNVKAKVIDTSTEWEEILPEECHIGFIQEYLRLSVNVRFDPPTNSSLLDAMNKRIAELESRINYDTDI